MTTGRPWGTLGFVDPDDTDQMLAFASTVPCPPPTERDYTMPEPEHEAFGPIVRPVTFLRGPLLPSGDLLLFDLASEDLEDDQS